jgi:hypothetical protein
MFLISRTSRACEGGRLAERGWEMNISNMTLVKMHYHIKATVDANTKLTARNEMSSKVRREMCKGSGTNKEAEACTNADRAEDQVVTVRFV